MSAPTIDAITDRVTAAFARMADARYAIDILERSGAGPVDVAIDTVQDERGGVQLVIVRLGIAGIARDRVLTAIAGGHGVPMADPAVHERAVRVA